MKTHRNSNLKFEMKDMIKKKKRCYFCDSTFQIFTCIHIELNEHNNADIYIVGGIRDSIALCDRLNQISLFDKVVCVEETRWADKSGQKIRRFIQNLQIVYSYFNINKIVERFLIPNTIYDEMYFSCHMLIMRLTRFYFYKHNYSTKYVMFDEGRGSYAGQFEHSSKLNKILVNMIFGHDASKLDFDKLLYQPKLDHHYEERRDSIKKLYSISDLDKDNLKLYESVFEHKAFKIDGIRFFFFDGLREEDFKTPAALNEVQRWYEYIEETVGVNNICVKAHPRAKEKYPHSCRDWSSSNAPAELDFFNLDLDNLIFITVTSTTVATPKIMFDKEPIVIILGEMDEHVHKFTEGEKKYFEGVKKLYRNKNKFIMPGSVGEMKNILQQLLNN